MVGREFLANFGADGPSGLLDQQRANAQLNGLDERVRARALDWTDDDDQEAFDVVLAADCVPSGVVPRRAPRLPG